MYHVIDNFPWEILFQRTRRQVNCMPFVSSYIEAWIDYAWVWKGINFTKKRCKYRFLFADFYQQHLRLKKERSLSIGNYFYSLKKNKQTTSIWFMPFKISLRWISHFFYDWNYLLRVSLIEVQFPLRFFPIISFYEAFNLWLQKKKNYEKIKRKFSSFIISFLVLAFFLFLLLRSMEKLSVQLKSFSDCFLIQ